MGRTRKRRRCRRSTTVILRSDKRQSSRELAFVEGCLRYSPSHRYDSEATGMSNAKLHMQMAETSRKQLPRTNTQRYACRSLNQRPMQCRNRRTTWPLHSFRRVHIRGSWSVSPSKYSRTRYHRPGILFALSDNLYGGR